MSVPSWKYDIVVDKNKITVENFLTKEKADGYFLPDNKQETIEELINKLEGKQVKDNE